MYPAITVHITGPIADDIFHSLTTVVSDCAISGCCILDLSMTKNTFIPDNTFTGLRSRSVLLPSALAKIGKNAFYNANILYITIPAEVQTIDDNAFSNSYYLKTVTFETGAKLRSIGKNAFRYAALTSLTL